MKKRLLTANTNIAAVAAFGGLTVMPMFPLFLEQHGIRYSVVALVITLWGLLSLKQMDTEPEPQHEEQTPFVFHKPQHRKNRRRLITAAVLVLMSGVMLFGAIKFIGATQADTPDCEREQQIRSECGPRGERPICPNLNPIPRCPLNAAGQTEQPFHKENTHE